MKQLLTKGDNRFYIQGPAGQLEAICHCPSDKPSDTIAVICHPHPLHGGAMQNKVVTTLARTFHDLDIPTVRFNFRGVGESDGSFADAIGETEDLIAVLNWVRANTDAQKIWLAGFSFGSYVAYSASHEDHVVGLICVAPPVHHYDFSSKPEPTVPWIVIQGDQDEVVPPEQVYRWLGAVNSPYELIQMPEATHFFHGQLIELKILLTEQLQKFL